MKTQILFRTNSERKQEFLDSSKYFNVIKNRTEVLRDCLIIPRYSLLPYHKEVEEDVSNMGGVLINNSSMHSYIASFDYYYDVSEYTFKTWFRFEDIPVGLRNGCFVVKGLTNSKKFAWSSKMFCNGFREVVEKGSELLTDSMIGEQGILIREYVPLETYEVLEGGLPLTNEWRFFFYKNSLIDYGYYWSNLDDMSVVVEPSGIVEFAHRIAAIIAENVNFFVLDIAKDINGKLWLVEVNDGCMSGLNSIPSDRFYKNLSKLSL